MEAMPYQPSFSYNEACICGQKMHLGDVLWVDEQVFCHRTCVPKQRYCTECRQITKCASDGDGVR